MTGSDERLAVRAQNGNLLARDALAARYDRFVTGIAWNYIDLAAALGVSEKAVDNARQRANGKLRKDAA